ncbi:MAG TPA: tetratricopeptide repeat protein [Streptosporangiaceae bacterium]
MPPERIPVQPEARAGLYRSLMASRRMLVLLDNARDSAQVTPLLPGSSGCLVLVTSRSPLTALVAEEARQVGLDVLSVAEARDLLALRLGASRVAREPAAADQIVTLTGRLPLALSIVTARAAAASLAGVSRADARHALAELTVTGLLTEPVPGRYGAHDLVRVYAAELSQAGEPAGQRDKAVGRLLAHDMHSSLAAWRHLIPGSKGADPGPLPAGVTPEVPAGHPEAVAWLAAERPALMAAIAAAADAGFDFYAQQLPFPLSEHLAQAGRWQDWYDIAHLSLAAARRRADTGIQGWALRSLAAALIHIGQPDEALACLNEALRLFTEAGDDSGLGRAHHGMIVILLRRGQHDQALECCQEAYRLCEQTGNRGLGADTIGNMGIVHLNRGEYDLAIARAGEAVRVFAERGQLTGEAEYLIVLGDALQAAGDARAARRMWRRVVDVLVDVDHALVNEAQARLAPPVATG